MELRKYLHMVLILPFCYLECCREIDCLVMMGDFGDPLSEQLEISCLTTDQVDGPRHLDWHDL